MPILFDLVLLLYSIVYLPYLLFTKRGHPDYFQRFGFFSPAVIARLATPNNIWIHAVSVGEVLAVEGFIRRLKAKYPHHNVVCSVTTKTGYELAQRRLADLALVIFSPLDFSYVVKRVAKRIHPSLYIAAETEIWPNLFTRLRERKVPIAIINGRISDRSFGRYSLIRRFLKQILACVNVFAMQSEMDASRIKTLGAQEGKVFNIGNIKFDLAGQGRVAAGLKSSKAVWVAGSTHPGEEQIILEIFKKAPPGWRLVIAPRHVERANDVLSLCRQAGFKVERFLTQSANPLESGDVIVIDAIGHLRDLYACASLVFVGKSLCVGGGQNVIEPAMFGKAIVVGPMTENFRDVVACFKTDGAIAQVRDAAEFELTVLALMGDTAQRMSLGQKARAVVERNQGAVDRALRLVAPWL